MDYYYNYCRGIWPVGFFAFMGGNNSVMGSFLGQA